MAPSKSLIVSDDADADIDSILLWTLENFGSRQANAYNERIAATLEILTSDPFPAISKNREQDIGPGYRSLHLGRRSRHLLLYRVEAERILIVRILHDSMELSRHLPREE